MHDPSVLRGAVAAYITFDEGLSTAKEELFSDINIAIDVFVSGKKLLKKNRHKTITMSFIEDDTIVTVQITSLPEPS